MYDCPRPADREAPIAAREGGWRIAVQESKLNSRREIHFIVNPVSGRSGSRALVGRLKSLLSGDGCRITIKETRRGGDCLEYARSAAESGADALVVAGGDGTLCEAAGGVHRARVQGLERCPILIVATGTENLLAKYLDVRGSAENLRQILREGREVRLDLATRDGHPFLLVAGIGFDAEVVRRLSAIRQGHISYLSYAAPLWRTFWSYRHPQVTVEADGVIVFEGPGLVFVGNIPRYAIGLRLLRNASPFDGVLDLCVFECRGHLGLIRHSVGVLLGRHIGSEGVVYRQARSIRVWSDTPVGVEIDGDMGNPLPATFEILPAAAPFLVAPGWSPAESFQPSTASSRV
ncbi:MAG: hypothetical protein DCC65_17105 [Planctomycetota bacterium]|nr:MAG: hypothetical protein DCC65_17105 [Planctomycetota bacterium]